MNWTATVGRSALAILLIGAGAGSASADQQQTNQGVGKGEMSQQKSQQGLGVEGGGGSSNVILGGPEIIVGQIEGIQGEEYAIKGDKGQSVKLRLTKDTNVVCTGGEGAQMSTARQDLWLVRLQQTLIAEGT